MLLNKNNTLLLAGLCAASLPSFSVLAEDVPTVVVSATRSNLSNVTIPSNIKVISREQIESSGATTLAEIIRSVGGVHIADQFGDGTKATISMRGFGSTNVSNTLVIVDGRRINNIDLSGPNLSSISVKDIEQVEIVQSSAGVLYGDQAVGGVINIITRKPGDFTVDAEVQMGSYDRTRFLTRLSDKLSNDFSYVLSADVLRADNYRDNNDVDNMNVLGHMDYEFSAGNVFVELQRITKDQNYPGALFAASLDVDRRQVGSTLFSSEETEIARIGGNSSINDQWLLEAELASRKFKSHSVYSPTFSGSIDSEQLEFTPRVIGNIPFNDGHAVITTGIDYLDADYEASLDDKQTAISYYAQAVLPLVENTTLTLGGRKARVENDMVSSNFTGKLDESISAFELGVQSRLDKNLVLFARYEDNFRFAKVDELSFTTPGTPLDIQKGESKEIGIEWNDNVYSLKAQIYRLDLENEIAYDPGAVGPGSPFGFPGANINLDPTVHDGLIVEGNYAVSRALDLGATFTYNKAVFKSGPYKDKQITGVPVRQVSVISNYRVTEQLKTFVEAIYAGKHYASGDYANQTKKLDSYTVVNANISYQWDELVISARVNNLLNKEYSSTAVESFGSVAFYPSPERNFWLSAAVRF